MIAPLLSEIFYIIRISKVSTLVCKLKETSKLEINEISKLFEETWNTFQDDHILYLSTDETCELA